TWDLLDLPSVFNLPRALGYVVWRAWSPALCSARRIGAVSEPPARRVSVSPWRDACRPPSSIVAAVQLAAPAVAPRVVPTTFTVPGPGPITSRAPSLPNGAEATRDADE